MGSGAIGENVIGERWLRWTGVENVIGERRLRWTNGENVIGERWLRWTKCGKCNRGKVATLD